MMNKRMIKLSLIVSALALLCLVPTPRVGATFPGINGRITFGAATPFAGQPVSQTLNPPPPAFLVCKAVGSGTICEGARTLSYGPVDTDIVCGSGANAFHIFDSGTFKQRVKRYYDVDGNLTRRFIDEHYTSGEFSNPLTGATVSYTQNDVIIDVLAVPGDFTSSIQTFTGENIYRTGTGAPVLIATGRQVFNFDMSELIFSAGRNAFIAAFFEGDTTAFDDVCAALGH